MTSDTAYRANLKSFGRLLAAVLALSAATATAQEAPAAQPAPPAVLIFVGRGYSPQLQLDYTWLQEMHGRGCLFDSVYSADLPAWDRLKQYHVLVALNLPECNDANAALLDRFLQAGGGLFLLPDLNGYAGTLRHNLGWNTWLARWQAAIALEHVHDLSTVATHPRSTRTFVYTDRILPSPVSTNVTGLWFPGGEPDNWAFHAWGQPIDVGDAWTVVARGSDSSFGKPMAEIGHSAEHDLLPQMHVRTNPATPPVLFAVHEAAPGRLALCVSSPIMHLFGGSSWIHDRVMLDKGLRGRPSRFGLLFENTLRWLAEPALAGGQLGGYQQDPQALRHPNRRKAPTEYFGEFDSYQNPTPPGRVFRGLVGARTAYSTGKGTVADYAAAARAAGLDFVVFTEELAHLTEANYRQLESDCRAASGEDLTLIPGMAMMNNIGNPMWGHGYGIPWPQTNQLAGPGELRLQCFDAEGKLTYSDEAAKNWLWEVHGVTGRNVGYYDFTRNPGVPVRNLRLFGLLALVTYRDGQPIEDLTHDYLDYVTDGCPPLACAMDVITSPEALTAAAQAPGHYLTHVAANARADIAPAMQYGHQYGRPNVYVSSGPQIKSWAGTQRFSTYAGESFVTARRLARPELWVTSEAGLKEILIYTETRLYRRFLCNGAKEFHETFQWAYDRHRELTAVVTDINGGRAVSAARSLWCDANYNGWCNDRQNGELWHGPGSVPGPRRPTFSVGPTWDGGPPPPAFGNLEVGPAVRTAEGDHEGWFRVYGGRWMEGNQFPTCYDDTVANAACLNAHVYAPGVVANAYHTLGPIEPSRLFTALTRRTQFMQRPAGVNLDWHAMYPERAGGANALFEGELTLKRGLNLDAAHFVTVGPHSYPKEGDNRPLLAIDTGGGVAGTGRAEDFAYPATQGLGAEAGPAFTLQPGGYVAMLPSRLGLPTVVFNAGEHPVRATASPAFQAWYLSSMETGECAAGDRIDYRFFTLYDAIDEPAINTLRVESLRRYFGFAGDGGCGLDLRRGGLRRAFGVIELDARDGVVEFTIPNPGWRINQPLGIRVHGLNPNWTVGQWQVEGYTQGFYTDGKNVYRQLGMDDRDLIHLAVYPDHAKQTHNVVGHPVVCDRPELIIEVTPLSANPHRYQVAINNPTDAVLKATLRRNMDLPGFKFEDMPVEAPAGSYRVLPQKDG